jgi:hypothetical protein
VNLTAPGFTCNNGNNTSPSIFLNQQKLKHGTRGTRNYQWSGPGLEDAVGIAEAIMTGWDKQGL